jgi:pimeloyl-ACP methyl ester carboxylesterase
VCLIATVKAREVCYGDLGCFTDDYPFWSIQRPISVLPDTPQKVGTRFVFYNKKVPKGVDINATNIDENFDPTQPTKFIIHGFSHNGIEKWVVDLIDLLVDVADYNVIGVDWSKGNKFPYTQATANTQIVGAEIAKLSKSMIANRGAKAADFHLIGHSLGSHISGYAGERLEGLGRITGLDPAGPYFENTDYRVRLDPSDALFVDAIHTDGSATLFLGLGLMQAVGHVDFYPNGGKDQTDCPATSGKILGAIFGTLTWDSEKFDDTTVCSHNSAIYLFIDSIKSEKCKYQAYPCASEKDFKAGKCIHCSSRGCNRMGLWASQSNDLSTLYLDTKAPLLKKDMCRQNYVVTLISNNIDSMGWGCGVVTVFFETPNQKSTTEMLDNSDAIFKQGTVEQRLVSLNTLLVDEIETLTISYKRNGNWFTFWLYDTEWSFKYVEIADGDRQKITRFCPLDTFIQTGSSGKFLRC